MLTPTYPITTARLQLRPFQPADLDDLYAIQSREDVTRYLYWGERTREEVAEQLQRRLLMDRLVGEGDILVLAAVLGDTVIGDVNLSWRSVEHRQGEFGF